MIETWLFGQAFKDIPTLLIGVGASPTVSHFRLPALESMASMPTPRQCSLRGTIVWQGTRTSGFMVLKYCG